MTDLRALLIEQWRDRPDAALASIEACLPVSRATNRSALEAFQGLLDDGLIERTPRRLVMLTASGREMLDAATPMQPITLRDLIDEGMQDARSGRYSERTVSEIARDVIARGDPS